MRSGMIAMGGLAAVLASTAACSRSEPPAVPPAYVAPPVAPAPPQAAPAQTGGPLGVGIQPAPRELGPEVTSPVTYFVVWVNDFDAARIGTPQSHLHEGFARLADALDALNGVAGLPRGSRSQAVSEIRGAAQELSRGIRDTRENSQMLRSAMNAATGSLQRIAWETQAPIDTVKPGLDKLIGVVESYSTNKKITDQREELADFFKQAAAVLAAMTNVPQTGQGSVR